MYSVWFTKQRWSLQKKSEVKNSFSWVCTIRVAHTRHSWKLILLSHWASAGPTSTVNEGALNGPFCSLAQLQGKKKNKTKNTQFLQKPHHICFIYICGTFEDNFSYSSSLPLPIVTLTACPSHWQQAEPDTEIYTLLDTVQLFMATTFNPSCKFKSSGSLLLSFIQSSGTTTR